MISAHWDRICKILTPAVAFQAILSGGGYASGREGVEYFLIYGRSGFWGLLLIVVGFWFLLFLAIEVARQTSSYNYKAWGVTLLGRAFPLLDIIFIVLSIIAIAVASSAAAEVLFENFQIPQAAAVSLCLLFVTFALYLGESFIISVKTFGTLLIYLTFAIVFIVTISSHKDDVLQFITNGPNRSGWSEASMKYLAYNTIVIPACLFTFRDIRNRREAFITSLLAAVLGITPLFIAVLAMSAHYPGILDEHVPIYMLIKTNGGLALMGLYWIALLVTLIDTGVGLIYAIIERLDDRKNDIANPGAPLSTKFIRYCIIIIMAYGISFFGIVNLIAKGYSLMAYAFLLVCIIPLSFVGVKFLIIRESYH